MKRQTTPVVLMVHTPDDSREMYAEYFRHHGLTVLCSSDVGEALPMALEADVIVTELRIPGALEGYDFIRQLRQNDTTRHKPVIVVTSWAWQTERLRAEEAGCDVFLTKPCFPDVLLRHVREAVRVGKLPQVPERAAESHRADRGGRKKRRRRRTR
jgi:two-component system, cell cycle response regulator DivK